MGFKNGDCDLSVSFLNYLEYKRFWFNIFQLEVLRVFHRYQHYHCDELNFNIPFSYLRVPKFLYFNSSLRYSFDIYIDKCYKLFSIIVRDYPILVQRSLFSIDSKFYLYFLEIKKKLFLSYIVKSIIVGEFRLYADSFESIFNSSKNFNLRYKFSKVHLLVPLSYLYLKLKYLGFFHYIKFRPIGNSKFLFLSDYSLRIANNHFSVVHFRINLD